MKKTVTCTICPNGCSIEVEYSSGVISSSGYLCDRGRKYAAAEITNPVRILSTTVRIEGGKSKLLPVRSRTPIPKNKMIGAVHECKHSMAKLNTKMGDTVVKNIAGVGIDMIACCDAI